MAQRGTSITALLRAYRIGQRLFNDHMLGEITAATKDLDLVTAAVAEMTDRSFAYVDRVSQQVVTAYQDERDRLRQNQMAVRTARVRSILSGQRVDPGDSERAPGYRLDRTHLGLVVWSDAGSDQLRAAKQAVTTIADQLSCQERAKPHRPNRLAAARTAPPTTPRSPRAKGSRVRYTHAHPRNTPRAASRRAGTPGRNSRTAPSHEAPNHAHADGEPTLARRQSATHSKPPGPVQEPCPTALLAPTSTPQLSASRNPPSPNVTQHRPRYRHPPTNQRRSHNQPVVGLALTIPLKVTIGTAPDELPTLVGR